MPISADQVVSKDTVLNWFATHYPKIKEGTVTAHLIRLSTNAPSRLHYSAKPGDDDLFFQLDGGHFRLYNPTVDPPPIRRGSGKGNGNSPGPAGGQVEAEDQPDTAAFAYETDLRNFLSKNLHLVQPSLRLYEEEGITGVEFPAGGRFIDILAVDPNGGYVVIELKVSRGYDRTVGQLRRYMGWIKMHHAEPAQAVRGIIVAREISEDLVLACSGLSDVALFEYEMSVSLKKVQ
ncbi:MAG TPA: endonuclease NucS domain-containing protein [Bryobacteraceae bacterium]|nr:endonuclease NucS domain-containing protein [Bryobacteraceae bacterium]